MRKITCCRCYISICCINFSWCTRCKKDNNLWTIYAFLPFCFSNFRQPPMLRVDVTMDISASFVVVGFLCQNLNFLLSVFSCCQRIPRLRSTSSKILVKVYISLVRCPLSTFKNFPRTLPMPTNNLMCQKCRDRLYSFTQRGILETSMVFGSNFGKHDVKKRPTLPQNHGSSFNVYSLSLTV